VLNGYLDWPGVEQVFRIERVRKIGMQVEMETVYGITSLPRTLAGVVAEFSVGEEGQRWLEQECLQAQHPDLRRALSDAIVALNAPAFGQSSAVAESLRKVLESSAKPLRDPTLVRPGTGRGKATRRIR